jgi:RNA polymerase sigma-70 factor, ECF subfamily
MSTTCVTEGATRFESPPRLRLLEAPSQAAEREAPMPRTDELTGELAGDVDGSFERVVRTFQDRLFSFALRVTGNREDAEEVAQDAFVRAYRALCTYPADRIRALALQAWLYRITLNVARNKMRGKRVRVVSIDNGGPVGEAARRAWEAPDDPDSRPDSRLENAEGRRDLASLVSTLPERYRSALVLRYVEGLRLEEVATILEQPLGTVKSNMHRAVNLLRRAISESRRAKR